MSGYTYPHDLSWMDEAFGRSGRLRELSEQVWHVNAWLGNDLYDVVEDWPAIPCPDGQSWADVVGAQLMELESEDERMALHIGFGGGEDEVLALRVKDHRYTRMQRRS